jgi:hypothetical protein
MSFGILLLSGCRESGQETESRPTTNRDQGIPAATTSTTQMDAVPLGIQIEGCVPVSLGGFNGCAVLVSKNEIRIYPAADKTMGNVRATRGTVVIENITSAPVRVRPSPNDKYLLARLPQEISLPAQARLSLNQLNGASEEGAVRFENVVSLEEDLPRAVKPVSDAPSVVLGNLRENIEKLDTAVSTDDLLKVLPLAEQIKMDMAAYPKFYEDQEDGPAVADAKLAADAVTSLSAALKNEDTDAMKSATATLRSVYARFNRRQ